MALEAFTTSAFYYVAIINALLGLSAVFTLIAWATKPPFWNALKKHLQDWGLHYAFWAAALSTGGSLWLSEVMGITPCKMCWLQRIAMYPLTVVFGVALFKRAYKTRITGLILAGTGFVLAGYHYLLQRANFWQAETMNWAQAAISKLFTLIGLSLQAPGCTAEASCSSMYLGYWGFYSIPVMALMAFFAIIVVLLIKKDA